MRLCSAIASGRSARLLVTVSSMVALSVRMRRTGAGRTGRRAGTSEWTSAAGAREAAGGGANGGVVPGPVDEHAATVTTIASRPKSSALPRQIAGYMALLSEDV